VIEIVKFDHISMAVPVLGPQIEFLTRVMGFRLVDQFESPEGYFGANLDVPGSSDLAWEVLAPNGPDSYLHRFLNGVSGPGLHHVALQIKDVDQAAQTIRTEGFEPWGYEAAQEPGADGDDGRGMVYMHPRGAGHGFLWQMYSGSPWHTSDPFEDEGERTLGIVAVNHLAHATHDRDSLAGWYERVLGCQTAYRSATHDNASGGFRTTVLDTPTRQIRFEMIEPAGKDSFIQRFLDARGPNMHHITVQVRDYQHALAALAHHKIPVFGADTGTRDGAAWGEAFIHPRHTGGMLVQFFWEERPGIWE
jgi:methylmalonyl-CoA epimerase